MMIFILSAIVIGVFAATITTQDANAASSCGQRHTQKNAPKMIHL